MAVVQDVACCHGGNDAGCPAQPLFADVKRDQPEAKAAAVVREKQRRDMRGGGNAHGSDGEGELCSACASEMKEEQDEGCK